MTEDSVPKSPTRGNQEMSLGELQGRLSQYDVRMWTDDGELRYYSSKELPEEIHHGIWVHRGILALIVAFELLFPEGPGTWRRVAEVVEHEQALLVTDPQEWRRRIHNAILEDVEKTPHRRN